MQIKGYYDVKELGEKWKLSHRTIQAMCANGRVKGAVKFGNIWAIPEDAQKPLDKRVKSGAYKNWRK